MEIKTLTVRLIGITLLVLISISAFAQFEMQRVNAEPNSTFVITRIANVNSLHNQPGISQPARSVVTSEYAKPYAIGIKSSVITSSASINIDMKERTDSVRFELFSNHGEPSELLFEGTLAAGNHQFQFTPAMGISRPYIAVLKIASKVVSMRVVKFNSF